MHNPRFRKITIFSLFLVVFVSLGIFITKLDFSTFAPRGVYAQTSNAITAGTFSIDPPTLHSLGFQWNMSGDANRNSQVTLQYRKVGTSSWKQGLPLLHMNGEIVAPSQADKTLTLPNKFAGSIFDLEPSTDYQVQLTLTDPDGGNQTRDITTKTKMEPQTPRDGRILHLYPASFTGTKQSPSYTEFQNAYNAAAPGDTILVHEGVHLMATSGYTLNKQGTYSAPIVIKGISADTSILDGQGSTGRMFTLNNPAHHIFENVTFRNSLFIFRGSSVESLTIRFTIFEKIKYPIICESILCKNLTILNNVISGTVVDWHPRYSSDGSGGSLNGSGHDYGYNTISNVWDGLAVRSMTPTAYVLGTANSSMDFYNNTIFNVIDDCIELDYGVHNIRVYRNYCYNAFTGISTQPLYGGPGYIFRNVVYNYTHRPLKFNVEPAGMMVFNNTFVGRTGFDTGSQSSNFQVFNNLFIGTNGSTNWAMWTGTVTPQTTKVDYNGYRINNSLSKDGTRSVNFAWAKPNANNTLTYSYHANFSDLVNATQLETHGKTLDYTIFKNAPQPSLSDTALPAIDLTLKSGSSAIDAGMVIPNITDGYVGTAPDMGAYEFGAITASPSPSSLPSAIPSPSSSPSPVTNPADIDEDGSVGLSDIKMLFGNWLVPTNQRADLNSDGKVNTYDFAKVVAAILLQPSPTPAGSPSASALPSPSSTAAGSVTGFTLINAQTGLDITTLANNSSINLSQYPSIAIRANTSPAIVASVRLQLSGTSSLTRTENGAPYTMTGDTNGVFTPWNATIGSYSLTATPFSNPDASGTAGVPNTVTFQVINTP